MMLGSYTSRAEKLCEKKRFSDIASSTKFAQMLYPLVDTKCLFQRDGTFRAKDTITLREATMTIMDYYAIEPTTGTSHFLDIEISDDLQ
jgi:hypothetical protein